MIGVTAIGELGWKRLECPIDRHDLLAEKSRVDEAEAVEF
jgi:hypothetical protein